MSENNIWDEVISTFTSSINYLRGEYDSKVSKLESEILRLKSEVLDSGKKEEGYKKTISELELKVLKEKEEKDALALQSLEKVAQLSDKVSSLTLETEEYKKQIVGYEQKISEMGAQIKENSELVSELTDKLSESQKSVKTVLDLQSEISLLNTKLADMTDRVDSSEVLSESLTKERERLNSELIKLQNDYNKLLSENKKSSVNAFAYGVLNRRKAQLEDENKVLLSQVEEYKQNVMNYELLSKANEDLQRELDDERRKGLELSERYSTLASVSENLLAESKNLQRELSEAEKLREHYVSSVVDLVSRIAFVHGDLSVLRTYDFLPMSHLVKNAVNIKGSKFSSPDKLYQVLNKVDSDLSKETFLEMYNESLPSKEKSGYNRFLMKTLTCGVISGTLLGSVVALSSALLYALGKNNPLIDYVSNFLK